MEMEYASRGKGNAALTTGIIGTAGVGLGLLGNLLGGVGYNNGAGYCGNGYPVSRFEMGQESEIAKLRSEIALRDANTYNDQKLLEMYKYVDGKFNALEGQICAQSVVNAQVAANIGCMQKSIDVLNGLTKTVVPINNICPEPMRLYNSWVAPTATAPDTAG